jgi:branched-chain amino acid transport system substrate-binding protein
VTLETEMKAARLAMLVVVSLVAFGFSARAEEPLKIGVLTDMEGPYSDVSGKGSVAAAEMAAEDAGPAFGQKVVVISAGHQNKADVGSVIARRWIEREHVDAIADLVTSSVALAVQSLANQLDRVTLISGGASSDLTGPACAPTSVSWTYDSYSISTGLTKRIAANGAKSWFFITPDYAFGTALQRDASAALERAGGEVVGSVRPPMGSSDMSSFLLTAQSKHPDVIALASAGDDLILSIRQAHEFGLPGPKQSLVGLFGSVYMVHGLGLKNAQGTLISEAFYWDMDEQTRAFSRRFFDRVHAMPSQIHAGTYSAVLNYIRAVQKAGTRDAKTVVATLREMHIEDMFARNAVLRADGRLVHDMYLFKVKSPEESKAPWDYYKLEAVIPGQEAFRPLAEGGCPLVMR